MTAQEAAEGQHGQMRPVFACVICGCTYLPPKTMEYPEPGAKASPLHCADECCRRACAALPPPVMVAMAAMAWDRARPWMDREVSPLPERARRRAGHPSRPGRARSKLR